jgi:hemerythrin-like domain-containing protein
MQEDPIIEEVRLYREQHAARFNYDLLAIYQNIKEQEHDSKRHFISYSKSYLGTNLKIKKD